MIKRHAWPILILLALLAPGAAAVGRSDASATSAPDQPSAAPAAQPDSGFNPPWWNTAWKYRVKVTAGIVGADASFAGDWAVFDKHDTTPIIALAEIYRENAHVPEAANDVRVVDSTGKLLPAKAYHMGKPDTLSVYFPVSGAGGDYCIYYEGKAGGAQAAGDFFPSNNALSVTTLQTAAQIFPITIPTVKAALRGDTTLHGRVLADKIDFSQNPSNLRMGNERYITCIKGLLNIELDGKYHFSVDSGCPAFLFIDGALTTSNTNVRNRPTGHWQTSGAVVLKQGHHYVRLILSEMGAFQGARLGWMRPGTEKFELVPAEAFAKHVLVKPREFEKATGGMSVYFTLSPSPVGIRLNDTKTVVPVELVNLSNVSGRRDVKYVWKIGNLTFHDDQIKVPLEAERTHRVRLEAHSNGQVLGTFERSCRFEAPDMKSAWFKLETISAPNIIFVGEKENLSFRVHSNVIGAISLNWRYLLKARPSGRTLEERSGIYTADSGESALSIQFDTDYFGQDCDIDVSLTAANVPLCSATFHVIPLGSRIEKLKSVVGCLVNGGNNRVIITTRIVDQAAFRRWALPKYMLSKVDFSKKKVLLYGSVMENPPCREETFTSYIALLRSQCEVSCSSFDFVKRSDEVNGVLADVPRFAEVLATRTPEVIVISPGSIDVSRGVAIRDFKRSVQVMIDMARRAQPNVRLVLVSPPPVPTNVELSRLYRNAIGELAAENHTGFVDIHTALDGTSMLEYFKSKLDDGVYYTYPNDSGQQVISDVIYRALR